MLSQLTHILQLVWQIGELNLMFAPSLKGEQ